MYYRECDPKHNGLLINSNIPLPLGKENHSLPSKYQSKPSTMRRNQHVRNNWRSSKRGSDPPSERRVSGQDSTWLRPPVPTTTLSTRPRRSSEISEKVGETHQRETKGKQLHSSALKDLTVYPMRPPMPTSIPSVRRRIKTIDSIYRPPKQDESDEDISDSDFFEERVEDITTDKKRQKRPKLAEAGDGDCIPPKEEYLSEGMSSNDGLGRKRNRDTTAVLAKGHVTEENLAHIDHHSATTPAPQSTMNLRRRIRFSLDHDGTYKPPRDPESSDDTEWQEYVGAKRTVKRMRHTPRPEKDVISNSVQSQASLHQTTSRSKKGARPKGVFDPTYRPSEDFDTSDEDEDGTEGRMKVFATEIVPKEEATVRLSVMHRKKRCRDGREKDDTYKLLEDSNSFSEDIDRGQEIAPQIQEGDGSQHSPTHSTPPPAPGRLTRKTKLRRVLDNTYRPSEDSSSYDDKPGRVKRRNVKAQEIQMLPPGKDVVATPASTKRNKKRPIRVKNDDATYRPSDQSDSWGYDEDSETGEGKAEDGEQEVSPNVRPIPPLSARLKKKIKVGGHGRDGTYRPSDDSAHSDEETSGERKHEERTLTMPKKHPKQKRPVQKPPKLPVNFKIGRDPPRGKIPSNIFTMVNMWERRPIPSIVHDTDSSSSSGSRPPPGQKPLIPAKPPPVTPPSSSFIPPDDKSASGQQDIDEKDSVIKPPPKPQTPPPPHINPLMTTPTVSPSKPTDPSTPINTSPGRTYGFDPSQWSTSSSSDGSPVGVKPPPPSPPPPVISPTKPGNKPPSWRTRISEPAVASNIWYTSTPATTHKTPPARDWPTYPNTVYCEPCFRHDCLRILHIRQCALFILELLGGDAALHKLRDLAREVQVAERETCSREPKVARASGFGGGGSRGRGGRASPPPLSAISTMLRDDESTEKDEGLQMGWYSTVGGIFWDTLMIWDRRRWGGTKTKNKGDGGKVKREAGAKPEVEKMRDDGALPNGETRAGLAGQAAGVAFHDCLPADIKGLILLRYLVSQHLSMGMDQVDILLDLEHAIEVLKGELGLSERQATRLEERYWRSISFSGPGKEREYGMRKHSSYGHGRRDNEENGGNQMLQMMNNIMNIFVGNNDGAARTGINNHQNDTSAELRAIGERFGVFISRTSTNAPVLDMEGRYLAALGDEITRALRLITVPRPESIWQEPTQALPYLPCTYCSESGAFHLMAARRPYPRNTREDSRKPWIKTLTWVFPTLAADKTLGKMDAEGWFRLLLSRKEVRKADMMWGLEYLVYRNSETGDEEDDERTRIVLIDIEDVFELDKQII